jgi:hypothetical protein
MGSGETMTPIFHMCLGCGFQDMDDEEDDEEDDDDDEDDDEFESDESDEEELMVETPKV